MTGPWLFDGPPDALSRPEAGGALPAAVLFDRDGTLVADVPYNGDPARVEPMPAARDAVEAVRALGIPVGVVSNQSGVARGLLTYRQVEAVRRRVDELFGPFAVWAICPHGPDDGCDCRKPAPGLVLAACDRLGVPTERTTVIGDIGSDMTAAHAAGARGVLVPTPVTRPEEIEAAESTAPDLLAAVRLVLGPGPDGPEPVSRAGVVPGRLRSVDPAQGANSACRATGGFESGHGVDGVRRTEVVPDPTAAVAPVGAAGQGPVDPAAVVKRACWAADAYEREADGGCRAETGPGRASATRPGGGMYAAGPEHSPSGAQLVGRTAGEAS
ncbi:D-glycero-alpha-D-manno-heptose-1,7-bisphosphate 7-phosphatase [Streptomyces xiangluensis]|uniref:D,D-heptose 1,7-bisphosphate phosphatase n=1 Tax=Streptomyces xiangluensis TaxID=2665720 RepID=A0ABV8YIP9_9ACTN